MHSARLVRAVGGGWRMFGKIDGFSPEISLSDVARRSKRAYEHSLRIFWNPIRGRRAIWAAPEPGSELDRQELIKRGELSGKCAGI